MSAAVLRRRANSDSRSVSARRNSFQQSSVRVVAFAVAFEDSIPVSYETAHAKGFVDPFSIAI